MIAPYKLRPVPPLVCLLDREGLVWAEDGTQVDLDHFPPGFRVWCSYDTARSLLLEGRGEALCWNGEEIKWRHERFEEGWKRRPSDVHVVKLPFYEEQPERSLQALVAWRDWLASHGASPTGTTGSASWSLLRAKITRPLWTTVGQAPPIPQTLGGRQQIGVRGPGRFEGRLQQLDLPAAYASELGNLRYGGHWLHLERGDRLARTPGWWALEDRPVFVRAQVRCLGGLYGGLPRRPRGHQSAVRAALQGVSYPTRGRLQGVWCWQELAAAEQAGAVRILSVLDTWVHLTEPGSRPFQPWWGAIQEGRAMPGLAGMLAKMTGNALWGRFCMDASKGGERSIVTRDGRIIRSRPLPFQGGLPPAHDLAETVSGRVRGKLFAAMAVAGRRLLSAHTDGIWVEGDLELPGWRCKEHARRLDLLDPQVLRYWPVKAGEHLAPWVVFAGVPSLQADESFAAAWAAAGYDHEREEVLV